MTVNLEKTPFQLLSKRLVALKHIQLIENDLDKYEVKKMNEKKTFLRQSYLLHLVANWEAFLENLLLEIIDEKYNNDFKIRNTKKWKVGDFHTPSKGKINDIFKEVLGIAKITDKWDNYYEDSGERLNKIMTKRHEIAHTGYSNSALDYQENFDDMKFIVNIAYITQYYIYKITFNKTETFEMPYTE